MTAPAAVPARASPRRRHARKSPLNLANTRAVLGTRSCKDARVCEVYAEENISQTTPRGVNTFLQRNKRQPRMTSKDNMYSENDWPAAVNSAGFA